MGKKREEKTNKTISRGKSYSERKAMSNIFQLTKFFNYPHLILFLQEVLYVAYSCISFICSDGVR